MSLGHTIKHHRAQIRPLTSLTVEISTEAIAELVEGTKQTYSHSDLPCISDNPLLAGLVKRELIGKMFCASSIDDEDSVSLSCEMFTIGAHRNSVVTKLKVKNTIPNFVLESKRSLLTTWLVLPSTRITIVDESTQLEPSASLFSFPTYENSIQGEIFNNAANILKHTFLAMSKASSINALRRRKSDTSPTLFNLPRSFVFTGPPGVGKTYSIRQVIDFFDSSSNKDIGKISLKSLRGSELYSLGYGDTEAELRKIFLDLVGRCKRTKQFGLIFIDEGEALLQSQGAASQLGSLLDTMSSASLIYDSNGWGNIVIVVATNHLESIPSTLRRPGRFDREVHVLPPNTKERVNILKFILNSNDIGLHGKISDQDLENLAQDCVGYVAADLNALVRTAILPILSQREIVKEKQDLTIDTLRAVMSQVGASALRDAVLSAPPSTRWDDIGGNTGGAKEALRRAIEWPRLKQKAFIQLGLSPPRGILLHGPPGCAKTTLARAAAGASGVAFFVLSPADVYSSSYVGEAESVIRRAFTVARSASPCILFFDEIDSILGSMDGGGVLGRGSSANAEARVLSTFLNEMDGVDTSIKDGVLVLGATNRPSILDAALLRPGRFDRVIYVPPPDFAGRKSIISLHCNKWRAEESVHDKTENTIDVHVLACEEISGHMTGAEIEGACQEAATAAFKECLENGEQSCQVLHRHVHKALKDIKPLLSDKRILHEYKSFEESIKM